MPRAPALFLGHGAPTLLIDPLQPREAFTALGRRLERPAAVLVASAHWLTAAPALGNSARPETIHDFYGFPAELYEYDYPAPGAPALAESAAALLAAAGFEAAAQPHGLDHGAWVPMLLMFPQADVPVSQLSIQPRLGPAHAWRVGEALRPLRDQGVMIIGSGLLTHNLGEVAWQAQPGQSRPWADQFAGWMRDRVAAHDRPALEDYRRQAPHAVRAHPTDEHLLPLFTALGAAGPEAGPEHVEMGMVLGSLAMDGWIWR